MKKYFYIFLLIFLFVMPSRIFSQDSYGYLRIKPELPDVKIIIDDSVYVFSEKIKLAAGTHTVRVQNPNRTSYQAVDFVTEFDIRPEEEYEVSIVFEKMAEINSFPSGAEVSLNSNTLGFTPFYLTLSQYPNHSLRFNKPGFMESTAIISDSVLAKNFIFMELKPKTGDQKSNQNQFANMEWQERGPHKYKHEIMTTVSMSILFGAGTAYYKKKADDAFEKAKIYRRSGNLTARDRQLDKTKKYDKYAAIGLVGMQVNAAALIYFLFRSK